MTRVHSIEYKWLVAIVFIGGLFMDLLDTTIVNVALPTLGKEFNAPNTTLEWVVTGYLLSLAVWIPASGWLGDRFGTKRVFLFALAMFTLGSALCGTAWSIQSLIAFRVLQGVGGGMLTPVGTAMLYRAFSPRERAQASAVLTIPIAVAPTIGPILGGFLVDYASWRWIFYVNLPIGILAFFFALAVLKEHTEPSVGRFDLPGFLLSATGLPLLLFSLSQAPGKGWTSPVVVATGLAGIVLMALLVLVETRVKEPMLALRLFRDRMFRSANIVSFTSIAGLTGAIFLLPLFLQQLRGMSALHSGLTTFPQALGLIAVSRFAAKLYPRIGPRRMAAVGMLGTAVTTACFLLVGLETDLWWIRAIMFVRGLFMGFTFIPVQSAMFSTIDRKDSGRASALTSTNRQVGSSVGVAVLATILTERTAHYLAAEGPLAARHAALLGFHDAFFASVLLSAVGVVFAFLIHDEDAVASMVDVKQPAPVAGRQAPAVAD
jgi:EmrB/QacA subfamily drug resistance transporter